MGKRLAIKGHPTRGNEVIELLEMMGGKKIGNITGDNLELCYLIDDENDIVRQSIAYEEDGLNIFTLEEFLERFIYKVGDEFCSPYDKITEMFWDEEDEIVYYKTEYSRDYVTTINLIVDNYARIK